MKALRLCLFTCIPLALAGCKVETEGGPADTAADKNIAPQTVQLAAVNNSGITAEAVVGPASGGGTVISVKARGMSGGDLRGRLHLGKCGSGNPPVAGLERITMGADSTGTSETAMQAPASMVMNGEHFIQLYQAGGEELGPPVACAEIPRPS